MAKTVLIWIQHSYTNNSNTLYFPQMDFAAIQCVIDRRMTHACTSVATDGGKKNLAHSCRAYWRRTWLAVPALSCFSCQTQCFGDLERHVNPQENLRACRKKPRTLDLTIRRWNSKCNWNLQNRLWNIYQRVKLLKVEISHITHTSKGLGYIIFGPATLWPFNAERFI